MYSILEKVITFLYITSFAHYAFGEFSPGTPDTDDACRAYQSIKVGGFGDWTSNDLKNYIRTHNPSVYNSKTSVLDLVMCMNSADPTCSVSFVSSQCFRIDILVLDMAK